MDRRRFQCSTGDIMASFEALFVKSKGKPIVYGEKTLVMSDRLPAHPGARFRLVFESANAEWRQGVFLRVSGSGNIVVNGERLTHAVCWRDNAPAIVDFEASEGVNSIIVCNVWDCGDGVVHSRHNGAAMIVEELTNSRRYHCNDGVADEDFDDIVFRIERH